MKLKDLLVAVQSQSLSAQNAEQMLELRPAAAAVLGEQRASASQPAVAAVRAALSVVPAAAAAPSAVRSAPDSARAIAIVGVSGAFPNSRNLNEYWANLAAGRDCISEVSERWPVERFYDPDPEAPGKSVSKWMGMLSEVDRFDPLFFGISPAEAELTDPQQRLFLEHCWSAIEEAGVNPHGLSESRCGVYVGCAQGDYGQSYEPGQLSAQGLMGNTCSILSARIAYLLNLKGPCLAIDTACSSSLVAIAEACDSLLLARCDLALAGGVNVLSGPGLHVMTSKAGMLSKHGRCYSFDERADGFVPGEGVGVVLLKRLEDAIAAGDHIHAVIRGWGVNQDGKTNGITAPSVNSQIALEKEVYARCGISPRSITLVEAHGTGTKLGDPIEVEALVESFRSGGSEQGYCALGSVKSNIGHLLAAAGVAGLMKLVLALRHRQIPPTVHFQQLNSHIGLARSAFYVNTQLKGWERQGQQPLRAALSSFGFSGTNAHVVIEEYVAPASVAKRTEPVLVVVSAKNEERLREQVTRLREYVQGGCEDLAALAYTLQVGRAALEQRLAFVAESAEGLVKSCDEYLRRGSGVGLMSGQVKKSKDGVGLLESDEDAGVLVQTWLRKKKLRKLGELWVKGLSVEWAQLYGTERPRRLSLPTYPFARERYWVQAQPVQSQSAGALPVLHPLMQRNTSDLSEQRFSSTFTGEEFFLRDHVVNGQRVLPGAAQLEMARAAAQAALGEAGNDAALSFKHVTWLRPVIVAGEPVTVHVAIHEEQAGELGYEIYSEGAGETLVHSQGSLLLERRTAPAQRVDVAALLRGCTRSWTAQECYAAFAASGLNYGAGHRGLQQLNVGSDAQGRYAIGTLLLPTTVANAAYVLHPSMLDSALQAALGLVEADSPGARVPFAIEAVQLHAPSPTSGHVVMRVASGITAQVQKLDLQICDERGTVCVELRGYSHRRIEAPQLARTLVQRREWRAATAPDIEVSAQPASTQHWVLAEAELVAALGHDHDCRVETFEANTAGLPQCTEAYAAQMLERLQALLSQGLAGEVLIQVLLQERAGSAALATALSALLKSAEAESTKLHGQVIVTDAALAARALAQDARAFGAAQIRYVRGTRQVLQLEAAADTGNTLPWRDGGVYWITGGGGGLGLIVAREIAQRVAGVKLILSGRAALSDTLEQQLRELRGLGAQLEYRQVDVTDAAAVRACVAAILSQHRGLNGIVHTAGVLRDNFIPKKTRAELQAVLAPKVGGTVNLDEATRGVALDFFMTFASAAGVFGNAGQTDYACANGFMDGYLQERQNLVTRGERQGRSLSIAWPLWAEGGMRVDEATLQHMRRRGLEPLPTRAALQALYAAYADTAPNAVVVHAVPRKQPRPTQPVIPAQTSAQPATTPLTEQLEAMLVQKIAAQLKLPPAEIDISAEFAELGFDSISLTELGNTLNHAYELELAPTVFFECPTLRSFAQRLAQDHGPQLAARFAPATSSHAGSAADQLQHVPATAASEVAPAPPATPVVSRRRGRTSLPVYAPARVNEPIAIIGMSGCFPQAQDLGEFWENLEAGRDCISEIPSDRWDWRALYGDPQTEANKTNVRWGGFIPQIAEFDPMFFGISPREAQLMDPQQRLLMSHVWRAIEDAGYSAQSLAGSKTGIFVGTNSSGYDQLVAKSGLPIEGYTSTGAVTSVGPNRMSFFLNVHGPSEPIETACSSSLVAVHRAVRAMHSGDCELAVVGGINTLVTAWPHISFSKAGMLCEDGRCKTFSAQANGYVRGEGVGMLVLKQLSAAERDGDHIYALIRGSAENHGGRANSLTAPNPKAQAELLKSAYREAQIDPRTVSYIEAHGTGTALGDPIEINGLKSAFKDLYAAGGSAEVRTAHCAVGTVKTNIGHLELAAGVAGMIKVLLQLKHRTLVKSLHCEQVNPYIKLEGSPFYFLPENRAWEPLRDERGAPLPRRAGVSSFGFGGVNAHVVLEEYVAERAPPCVLTGPALIVLSARNAARLQGQVQQLHQHVRKHAAQLVLADLAYTLQVGREPMEHRLAFSVGSLQELGARLEEYLASAELPEGMHRGEAKRNREMVSVFSADEELQEAIGKWLQRGKYAKVLDLWVKGLSFDWLRLYGATRPRRISLPGYAFARERYWVPVSSTVDSAATVATLHPLLHRNTSNLREQRFTSVFTGDEFFLRDHVVKGQRLLPGVAYLEMARAAVQASSDPDVGTVNVSLKQVTWLRPVIAGEVSELHIGLREASASEVEFEIYSGTAERSVLHCQGRAVLGSIESAAKLDLAALQRGCVQQISAEQCYEQLLAAGLAYGAAHRGIRSLEVCDSYVLARLELPTAAAATGYELHPSMLDSALQASLGLSLGAAAITRVPFALESLQIHAPTPAAGYTVIRRAAHSSAQLEKLDVQLCDAEGRVCVQINGYTSRVLEFAAASAPATSAEPLLLQRQWRAAPEPTPVVQSAQYSQHCVVLPAQYAAWAAGLRQTSSQPRCVVLDEPEGEGAHGAAHSAGEVFAQVQTLLETRSAGDALLQVVLDAAAPSGLQGALAALLRTAQQEQPRLRCQLVRIDAEDARGLEQQLSIAAACDSQEVRYENGKCCVPALAELPALTAGLDSTPPWREDGVYWITGGAGGLGAILAQEILRRAGRARIVLSGRSQLGVEQMARLQSLLDSGQVEYQCVDVCEVAAVRDCVAQIVERYGALHGIVHSAGVVQDNLIIKKSAAEFQQVLAPKLAGTVNLDLATRQVPLDFFVAFSSLAGVFGNPGQADYACGNGFMDDYLQHREVLRSRGERHGCSLSIAWPLWAEGGMRVAPAMLQQLRRRGYDMLETQAGLAALHAAFASSASPIIVVSGDTAVLRQRLLERPVTPAAVEHSGAAPDLQRQIEDMLVARIAELQKLPESEIDVAAQLTEFGFDSISLTELGNVLHQAYGVELSPTLFFEYPTVSGLAGHLAREHTAIMAAAFAMPATSPATPVAEPVAAPVRRKQQRGRQADHPVATREVPSRDVVVAPLTETIAIIGMNGCFPQADDLAQFWDNLQAGRDCISEVPRQRWSLEEFYEADPQMAREHGRSYSKWGGFLSLRKARLLTQSEQGGATLESNPKAGLFFDTVNSLLVGAGHGKAQMAQRYDGNVGVYVGAMADSLGGFEPAVLANAVSARFGLNGPSLAIDTISSSSMTALHMACQDLLRGDSQLAIAGGIHLLQPSDYIQMCSRKLLGTHPGSRSFANCDGLLPAEGVGAVLLKPLSRALADGDTVLGVIRSTTLAHAGGAVPSLAVQQRLIASNLAKSQVDPRSVSYVEASANGSPLGDALEVAAVSKVLDAAGAAARSCPVGTVKSNIGHALGVSGMSQLLKVMLQLQHRKLVPSIGTGPGSAEIVPATGPLYLQRELIDWQRPRMDVDGISQEMPRRAIVNSFGAGGSYVSVLLEEAPLV